jgi:hypothetical protein
VLPPVLAGARMFVETHREKLAEIDRDQAKLGEASPFDSHPPLPERIAAIQKLTTTLPALASGKPDPRLAIELVKYPEKVVRDLIAERVKKPLTPIEWSEVAPHFMTSLHHMLAQHRSWLTTRAVSDLDRSHETARTIARALEGIGDYVDHLEDETLRRIHEQFYTAAFSVALEHAGYEARTGPGEPLRFHRGDEMLEPGALTKRYLAGELTDEAWFAVWDGAGLDSHPWAAVSWKKPPSRFAD